MQVEVDKDIKSLLNTTNLTKAMNDSKNWDCKEIKKYFHNMIAGCWR